MKKFKVAVSGMAQFQAAQAALFAMGFGWSSGGQRVREYSDVRQIYVSYEGHMSYSTSEDFDIDTEQILYLTATGILLTNEAASPLAEVVEVPRTERRVALSRGTDPTQLELEVLNAIRAFGPEGATQDDVLTKLRRISHSSITPRFRPLLNKGLLVDTGLKRKGVSGRGQRVMMAAA